MAVVIITAAKEEVRRSCVRVTNLKVRGQRTLFRSSVKPRVNGEYI